MGGAGFVIVPFRYPNTPRLVAAMRINCSHVAKFAPSNFSVLAKIGGFMLDDDIFVGIMWDVMWALRVASESGKASSVCNSVNLLERSGAHNL